MKRTLIKLGKFSLTLAGLLFLAAAALAQTTLREALDFDLDGKADYVMFRPSNSTWYVLKSSNGTNQSQQFSFSLSTRDYFTPGDYDGDNKADYSVWRNSNGYWYQYRSGSSTLYSAQYGTTGDEPVARDYDGDGKTDFAVVRRSAPVPPSTTGQMTWYVLRSSDSVSVTTQWGYDTDFPAPGDYDGDGKFDRTVQRPGATFHTQAVFYTLRSSDSNLQTLGFGRGNDLVVPGDYDGDGKTDVAIVREGATSSQNLVWYIQQSTAGYRVETFGLTGSDKPAQNDYDGDGKTDLGVWRETNGTFYVQRSTDSGLTTASWGAFGDYPVAGYDTH